MRGLMKMDMGTLWSIVYEEVCEHLKPEVYQLNVHKY